MQGTFSSKVCSTRCSCGSGIAKLSTSPLFLTLIDLYFVTTQSLVLSIGMAQVSKLMIISRDRTHYAKGTPSVLK